MYARFEVNENVRGNEAYPAERSNRVLRSTRNKTEPYKVQEEDRDDNTPIVVIPAPPPAQVNVPNNTNLQSTSKPVVIENDQQLQQPQMSVNKVKSKVPKKKILKKKGKANLQPPISSHVQPYSMVEDIKNQQARITFGQLIEIAPRCKTELARGIRKPTMRKVHFSDMEAERSTAMYCDATIRGVKIPLIIDSGAAGSIVTSHFLSKLGIHIDRLSTTSMVNVNGEKKMPMGEVLNFPITVQGIEVPVNVVVTEAETYSVIVGNDWLRKVKANIDYKTSTMTISWKGKEAKVPVEYQDTKQTQRTEKDEEENSEEEDSEEEEEIEDGSEEEEYEEAELENRL